MKLLQLALAPQCPEPGLGRAPVAARLLCPRTSVGSRDGEDQAWGWELPLLQPSQEVAAAAGQAMLCRLGLCCS